MKSLLTAVIVAASLVPSAACAMHATPALLVRADNGATRFKGDTATRVTVSPNGDGFRDSVAIHLHLRDASSIRFHYDRHGEAARRELTATGPLGAGDHLYRWTPPSRPVPATYVVAIDANGATARIVVHVQGIDAAAGKAAYHPGDTARLAVSTDARGLTVDVLRITGAAP